jgi:hypothetical protein
MLVAVAAIGNPATLVNEGGRPLGFNACEIRLVNRIRHEIRKALTLFHFFNIKSFTDI